MMRSSVWMRCPARRLITGSAMGCGFAPYHRGQLSDTALSRRWHGGCGHSHGHHHHHKDAQAMTAECRRITLIGAATNVVFSVGKIGTGVAGGSAALIADGFHCLVDFLSDTITLGAIHICGKKVTKARFPRGLGRVETFAAFVISFMLVGGALGLFWGAIWSLHGSVFGLAEVGKVADAHDHHGHDHGHSHGHSHGTHGHSHFQLLDTDDTGKVTVLWAMVAVALSSLVIKEVLFRVTKRIGENARSPVVLANAYHHRADALSSAVALVGVAGTCAGVPAVDAVCSLAVAAMIAQIGYSVGSAAFCEVAGMSTMDTCADLAQSIQTCLSHAETGAYTPSTFVKLSALNYGKSFHIHITLVFASPTTTINDVNGVRKALQALLDDTYGCGVSVVSVDALEFLPVVGSAQEATPPAGIESAFVAMVTDLADHHNVPIAEVSLDTERRAAAVKVVPAAATMTTAFVSTRDLFVQDVQRIAGFANVTISIE